MENQSFVLSLDAETIARTERLRRVFAKQIVDLSPEEMHECLVMLGASTRGVFVSPLPEMQGPTSQETVNLDRSTIERANRLHARRWPESTIEDVLARLLIVGIVRQEEKYQLSPLET